MKLDNDVAEDDVSIVHLFSSVYNSVSDTINFSFTSPVSDYDANTLCYINRKTLDITKRVGPDGVPPNGLRSSKSKER